MSMGPFEGDSDEGLMNEINMTPLVDVMLVLLIIFLVTIPVMNNAVKIDLPQASTQPLNQKPAFIDVSIKADGTIFWDKSAVDDASLATRVDAAAKQTPQPEVHLRADKNVRYERVAQFMAAAENGGLSKIGFVTDPAPRK
ncbi:biopolymer transporter ExbD [Robbsia andropogonis]|uniref:Biopolymer transporter ExbD n=1 Tax=Robbsia andropogonis TaxID=28092 RepID=A0A0F5K0T9_9BURK|nr:biopolymer transporter ExbD [Robbsia andropogonis]KKB63525.1 biopolymer transporter ExbD [Robbsia andropogonis]MCP1116831.1 biopolymer transporter ExbD [Robbsia andropogonis]MCP1126490.1 biopolymer transporter ExbD [Robbsia andropogonis]